MLLGPAQISLLCTRMAPSSTRDSPISLLSTRDRHKLRKPAVEKMRRDRINSCIEQLKVLLEKEFHKQDPNAKLEKADVLEMTVAFLKQQLQPPGSANGATPHSDGYSRCWKETLHFLSSSSLEGTALPRLAFLHAGSSPAPTSHSHMQAAGKQQGGPHREVWRPW